MSLLSMALALPAAAASPTPPAVPAATLPVAATVVSELTFEQLEAEYDDAYAAWYKRYRGAKTSEERGKLSRENPTPEFVPRFFELGRSKPGTDDAYEALAWVVENGEAKSRDEAVLLIEQTYLERKDLHTVSMSLRDPSLTSETFLRRVVAKSPHAEVRAWSSYALAQQLKQQTSVIERLDSVSEDQISGYRNYFGAETLDAILKKDAGEIESEVESLLAKVCEGFEGEELGSLLDYARGDLFEIRNLAVGKVAPEIEGEDLDGVAFKLSDYRGKVVVLDFWGNW